MKKILLMALGALMMAACDDGNGENTGNKEIEVTGGQTEQTFYADDTQSKGMIRFKTTGAWTSSILEGAARAQAPTWLSISPDHGDAAGDYSLDLSLDAIGSVSQRTATIVISCGTSTVNITVTQKATKEEDAPGSSRLITKITESVIQDSGISDDNPAVFVFKYDADSRKLTELHITNTLNGERDDYVYTYDYSTPNEIKISDNWDAQYTGTLNSQGYVSKVTEKATPSTPMLLTYTTDGCLQRMTQDGEVYEAEWQDGNLVYDGYGENEEDRYTHLYTKELNNKTNIDLDIFFTHISDGAQSYWSLSLFSLVDKTGKRNRNYALPISYATSNSGMAEFQIHTDATAPEAGRVSFTWYEGVQDGVPVYSFDAEGYPVSYARKMTVTQYQIVYTDEREYIEPRDDAEKALLEANYGPGPWFIVGTAEKALPPVTETYTHTITYDK